MSPETREELVIKREQSITVSHLLSYCGSGEEKLQDGRQSNAGVTSQQQSLVIKKNTTEKITKEGVQGHHMSSDM